MNPSSSIFKRNIGTITAEQQQRLLNSHAVIIGCGGLGGYAAEELCRIGVGTLTLFDPDTYSLSNCNRQLNALQSTLGNNKAEVTARRLKDIGTGCSVRPTDSDFRAADIFVSGPDIIIDCLDSIEARHELADQCFKNTTPMVHGTVLGWCGRVGVQLPGYNIIRKIYPQDPDKKDSGKPPSVLSFTVAVIASMQVAEAVKVLLGQPSSLHNSWVEIDLKNMTFDPISPQ